VRKKEDTKSEIKEHRERERERETEKVKMGYNIKIKSGKRNAKGE
jgi:hypothetical protein